MLKSFILLGLVANAAACAAADDVAPRGGHPTSTDVLQRIEPAALKRARCVVQPDKPVSTQHSLVYRKGRLFFSSAASVETYRKDPKGFQSRANFQLVVTKQYLQHACPLSGETPDEDGAMIRIGGIDIEVLCADCAKEISNDPLEEQIEMLFDADGFRMGKFEVNENILGQPSDVAKLDSAK